MLEWSGDIGSDISFFFSSGTAYCTGRGEIVRDMPALLDPMYPILLIKPSSPLSTGAVYKALDVNKCSNVNPDELLERFYNEKTPSQVSTLPPHRINFIHSLDLMDYLMDAYQIKPALMTNG